VVWLIVVVVAAVVIPVAAPMQCAGVIAKSPYRGCYKIVPGLFGRCRYHGFQPRRRVIRLLGGQKLLMRRACDKCGQPRVYGRHPDSGRPFLGCAGHPACTRSIELAR
jgi:hypothetical protein